ncbi:hypothetical protein RDI61_01660 [Pseudomonas plecoglossicida]|uniref:DUF6694 family lipoprotein n=1 Tax=Pseudomonas TaxID=286 RepID=UPI00240F95CD|nr:MULTISPECIES: DUF6694 family lipoprotein [Pseudomonas]MDN5518993.1 hypothetical protein [Pseudomonas sp.]MDN5530934.1 hypothetical protein [Pseudomonas sp.]MDQ7962758.1 hypothetical protein [Pseudomonas plecoglossicida]WFG05244.1 hypothetical protein P3X84_11650 [Pseudomonas putida]
MRRVLALVVICGALSGCGEPKIDGSSEEAFKASIDKIAKSLPEEEKNKFTSDMMYLVMQGVDFKDVMSGRKNADDVASEMRTTLGGKGAKEVSAEADRVRAERAERERQQALSEILDLEKKKTESEKAAEQLKKFEVQKSRFYKRVEEYSFREKPVIEVSIKNGTGQAVSRAYFKGTISSPGRSVPWLVESFNYEISGGVEPGEAQSWSLAPNQFSKWGDVDPPKDAMFTVEVVRLDGADKEPLFGSGQFDERDAARLESLKKQYPN